jgi:hypothetical protein
MRFFSVRLILALFVGITLVSVGSTYFEVLAHKHALRRDLEQRTMFLGRSLQQDLDDVAANGQIADMPARITQLRSRDEALGLALYDPNGTALAVAGPNEVFKELSQSVMDKAIRKGVDSAAFGHDSDHEWLEEAIPLNSSNKLTGVLIILEPLAREVETMAESLVEARAAAAGRGAAARRRRTPLDGGAAGGAHSRAARFQPDLCRLESRAVHACAAGLGDGLRGAAQRAGHGHRAGAARLRRRVGGAWQRQRGSFHGGRVRPPARAARRSALHAAAGLAFGEEEAAYYDGFANEGLWPLCHIAHTRPIFRASDWDAYQRVNEKFAAALLEEMEGSRTPSSLCRTTTSRCCRGSSRRRGRMPAWRSSGIFRGPIRRRSAFAPGRRSCLTGCWART